VVCKQSIPPNFYLQDILTIALQLSGKYLSKGAIMICKNFKKKAEFDIIKISRIGK